MPDPVSTNVGFDTNAAVPSGVALIPTPELEHLKGARAVSRNYGMVSAPGLPSSSAVRLRLESSPGDVAVINEDDFLSMRGPGVAAAAENHLLVRRLRLSERLGLIDFWNGALMLVAVAAGLCAIASVSWPVHQAADQAKIALDRVAPISSALTTLEQQPAGFTALAQTATRVQFRLSAPISLGSSPPTVLPRDQYLAEVLEHAVADSGPSRGSGQHAATGILGWQVNLKQDARNPTSGWKSLFDTLATVFAAAAGALGAVLTFWRKPATLDRPDQLKKTRSVLNGAASATTRGLLVFVDASRPPHLLCGGLEAGVA